MQMDNVYGRQKDRTVQNDPSVLEYLACLSHCREISTQCIGLYVKKREALCTIGERVKPPKCRGYSSTTPRRLVVK